MTSQTEIANLALSVLGEAPIFDLEQNSPSARACKRHYESTRDALLRHHRWNFAIKRTILSRLEEDPAFGWAFAYQLPNDCLRVLELNGKQAGTSNSDFEIEGDHLLTNAEVAMVRYTGQVVDARFFDSLFLEALSYKLASAVAMEVTGSLTKKEAAERQFRQLALVDATFVDSVETRPKVRLPSEDSNTIGARYGGGDVIYDNTKPTGDVVIQGAGSSGWTPVFAVASDGSRRVLQVVDWIGGTGTKPATGQYLGDSGFVNTAAEATDIRGEGGTGGLGSFTAAATLESHRWINITGTGQIRYADSSLSLEAHGLIITGPATGESAEVFNGGKFAGFSSITPGATLFLTTEGQMSETAPTTGISQPVAVGASGTEIFIDIGDPTTL